MDITETLIYI